MLKILNYLKAIASLVGAIGTALMALYTDNETLTIIVVVATAVVTWAVPNIDVAEADAEHSHEEYEEGSIIYANDSVPLEDGLPIDAPHGGVGDSRPPQDSWPSHDR